MVGTTLVDLREHVEALASQDGEYGLVCARTGERPIPAAGMRFASRPTARAAARATEQYRATLRRYDPQVPYYDVIVQESPAAPATRSVLADAADGSENGETGPSGTAARALVEFCHAVAGVVFETIAASEHDDLEDAIMGTYFAVAETVDHPDELCLRLLESVATELDDRLDPAAQAAVLSAAADDLPIDATAATAGAGDDPLETTLARLRSAGLLAGYRIERCSADRDTGTRSWEVRIDGYALGEAGERIVTLPIVVELLGRLAARSVRITGAERMDEPSSWRLAVTTGEGAPSGLACLADGSGR